MAWCSHILGLDLVLFPCEALRAIKGPLASLHPCQLIKCIWWRLEPFGPFCPPALSLSARCKHTTDCCSSLHIHWHPAEGSWESLRSWREKLLTDWWKNFTFFCTFDLSIAASKQRWYNCKPKVFKDIKLCCWQVSAQTFKHIKQTSSLQGETLHLCCACQIDDLWTQRLHFCRYQTNG